MAEIGHQSATADVDELVISVSVLHVKVQEIVEQGSLAARRRAGRFGWT